MSQFEKFHFYVVQNPKGNADLTRISKLVLKPVRAENCQWLQFPFLTFRCSQIFHTRPLNDPQKTRHPHNIFFPCLWTRRLWVWDSKVILKWLWGFYFLLSILVFSQLPSSSLWEKGVSNSASPWDCRGGTVSGSTGAARTQSPCLSLRDGPSARLPLQ